MALRGHTRSEKAALKGKKGKTGGFLTSVRKSNRKSLSGKKKGLFGSLSSAQRRTTRKRRR